MTEEQGKTPFKEYARQIYVDAGKSLMLQNDIYQPYLDQKKPFRFGCGTLVLLLLPAAIALGIGVALNLATLPRADLIQGQIKSFLDQSAMVQSLAIQYPGMKAFLNLFYSIAWIYIRVSGIYPYPSSIFWTPISFIAGVLFTWWLYTVLLQLVAGWLGGKVKKGGLYGPMVFAFAPQLLNVFAILPAFSVPFQLITAWTIAISYQILRAVYGFTWGRTVMTLVLTLLLHLILIALSIIFGVIIGVAVAGAMA